MASHSRRFETVAEKVDSQRRYSIDDAAKVVKETATAKFDESVEVTLQLGIDGKRTDHMVRGSVSLPKGTGKSVRIVAFVQGEGAAKALAAGAVEAGADELIAKVTGGWTDFDVAVAHPEMMPKVGRLGRILGPKGLMPSPKAGTVSEDVEQTVREYMGGRVEYRSDATGCVHALVGKASFAPEDLVANINAFIDHVAAARPQGAKGVFLRDGYVASTMGPGIRIELNRQV